MKYLINRIVCFCLHIFWIFPINRGKVVFIAFSGRGMSCNPYYIYRGLRKADKSLKCVWFLNDKSICSDSDVIVVRPNTFFFVFHLITAAVVITNGGLHSFIPYRKSQLLIDTWHGGGAYKHSGLDNVKELNFYSASVMKNYSRQLTYMISSSKKFSEAMKTSRFLDEAQFLNIGMPRNDLFFNKDEIDANRHKVRTMFKIPIDNKLVLYAPTYRGTKKKVAPDFEIDFERIKLSLMRRFGNSFTFFFRGHYFLSNTEQSSSFINVSSYPDMQELLCAADVFITDYSSCMWDFALTYKPGFLFTPDIEQYENERGVYTPVSTWPFPYAKTNEELCELIENYDEEKAKQKIKAHFDLLGSYEDGHASERISNIICKWIKTK